MRKTGLIAFVALLWTLTGCGHGERTDDALVTVDVTRAYPEKRIAIQELFDIEYVPLETTDTFLMEGRVADVGERFIAAANPKQGDILLFDRATGKGVRAINHRGQGPGEYGLIFDLLLDEPNNEMFVNDGPASKIHVYDLEGNFKRTIPYEPGVLLSFLVNYDEERFLAQCTFPSRSGGPQNTFYLLSKRDGSLTGIPIPYERKISVALHGQNENGVSVRGPRNHFVAPYRDGWLLAEPSADTIYLSDPQKGTRPFIIRVPSIQGMEPAVFLFPGAYTGRYLFLQSVKKEYDFEREEGFPATTLMFDSRESKFYACELYDKNYPEREIPEIFQRCLDKETLSAVVLENQELVDASRQGKLKGELKEIAERLDEDDNPTLLIVKYKK